MDLLHHLELFEAVAEEEHFGRAAQAVGMAQPPMSQAIRRLEKELGCALFQRTPRGALLTEAGRRVQEEARRLEADVERLRAAASAAADTQLELLVDPGCPEGWASRLVSAAGAGGVDVRLRAVPTTEAVARVREHGGLALVLAPVRTEGLRVSRVASCRLWESVPGSRPRSPRHALVHENPSAPALRSIAADLRAQGMTGTFSAEGRLGVAAELGAGRLTRALTIGRPHWPLGGDVVCDERMLPAPVSARFQLIARRDERSRDVQGVWAQLQQIVTELPDAD